MENTLSSLFASVEWRQLPWLRPSEAEAWFEARGATGTKWLLMVRLYKWLSERVIYRWHFHVGQHSGSATNGQFHIISSCQRRLWLMKQDKSYYLFAIPQQSRLNILRNTFLNGYSVLFSNASAFFKEPCGNFQCTPIKMQIVYTAWCPPRRITAEY